MTFNIEVNMQQSDYCEVYCPEMGISTSGRSLEEALNKIRNLLVYYTSTIEEAGVDVADRQQVLKQLRAVFGGKNIILPPRPKVN